LKYCTSYEGAYLMKRGLFLPDDVASVAGEELAREGLMRLGMLDLIREASTPDPGTPFARVMALESSLLLRSQLLRDIDWASMAHSLEVRVPLVDAFLLRKIAPAILASGRRKGKDLLAASPRQPLPAAILERKKSGFTFPIRTWLGHDREAKKQFGGRPWAIYVLEAGGHLPSPLA
jgi:asparagine synthase (glutamine-hydrolysing)